MSDTRDRVVQRRIEVTLAAALGAEQPPDVVAAVRERLRHRPRTRDAWLAAALILLGLSATLAVALAPDRTPGGSPSPRPGWSVPAAPQDPGEIPVVRGAAEIAELTADTRAVRGLRLDAEAFAALERLRRLEELQISAWLGPEVELTSYVLPEGAAETIAGLTRLRSVSLELLDFVEVDDLAALARIPTLETLRIYRIDELEDEHLAALGRFPALRRLHFEGSGAVTDDGLRALVEEVPLVELRLRGVFELTKKGYLHIARLEGLQVLDLSAPWFLWPGVGGFSVMSADESPEELMHVDDDVLAVIGKLENLRVLSLGERRAVTDRGLRHFAGLEILREIDLSGCRQISDAGLRHLPATVQVLDLTECRGLGADFPEHLRALRKVVIADVPKLNDAGVERIAALPEMRHLDLRNAIGLTPACVPAIAGARGLEYLSLQALAWLDDETLAALSSLDRLEHLDVGSFESKFSIGDRKEVAGGPTSITSRGVVHLAGLTRLRHLNLSAAQPLEAASLRALRHLPLREIKLNWTAIDYDEETPDLQAVRALWPGAELQWWPPQ